MRPLTFRLSAIAARGSAPRARSAAKVVSRCTASAMEMVRMITPAVRLAGLIATFSQPAAPKVAAAASVIAASVASVAEALRKKP